MDGNVMENSAFNLKYKYNVYVNLMQEGVTRIAVITNSNYDSFKTSFNPTLSRQT